MLMVAMVLKGALALFQRGPISLLHHKQAADELSRKLSRNQDEHVGRSFRNWRKLCRREEKFLLLEKKTPPIIRLLKIAEVVTAVFKSTRDYVNWRLCPVSVGDIARLHSSICKCLFLCFFLLLPFCSTSHSRLVHFWK